LAAILAGVLIDADDFLQQSHVLSVRLDFLFFVELAVFLVDFKMNLAVLIFL